MIDIEDSSQHLTTLKAKDWAKLFALIPRIDATETFGKVEGGKFDRDVVTAPYWIPDEIVGQTVQVIRKLNINPVFDWPQWEEGRSILENKDFDYSSLDTINLCKLLTTIIRADRFSEGYMISCFQNGIMTKIIRGLESQSRFKADYHDGVFAVRF